VIKWFCLGGCCVLRGDVIGCLLDIMNLDYP
jgi:hypothetical protein